MKRYFKAISVLFLTFIIMATQKEDLTSLAAKALDSAVSFIQKGDYKTAERYFNWLATMNNKIVKVIINRTLEIFFLKKKFSEIISDDFKKGNFYRAKTGIYYWDKLLLQDDKDVNKIKNFFSLNLDKNMVKIPKTTFVMGNTDELLDTVYRAFAVSVDSFFISKYEITNDLYAEFLNKAKISYEESKTYLPYNSENCKIYFSEEENRYYVIPTFEKYPVVVSWIGANAFAKFVNASLPTEAQWELVAKEASINLDSKIDLEQIKESSVLETSKIEMVGSKKPNNLGIYNIYGNAAEWVLDNFKKEFDKSDQTLENPIYLDSTSVEKIYKGGHYKSSYEEALPYKRYHAPMDSLIDFISFRIVIQ